MKRVYVAGPMSATNILTMLDNIHQGIKAGAELIKAGYSPFVPHLDIAFKLQNGHDFDVPVQTYYDYTIEWLPVSDMMLVLPGWEDSIGTKKEIERAKELNIPIYYSLDDLLLANNTDKIRELLESCLFETTDVCVDKLSKGLNVDKQDIKVEFTNNSNDVIIKLPEQTIAVTIDKVANETDIAELCPISFERLMKITGKSKEELLCSYIPSLLNTYKFSFVDGVLDTVY